MFLVPPSLWWPSLTVATCLHVRPRGLLHPLPAAPRHLQSPHLAAAAVLAGPQADLPYPQTSDCVLSTTEHLSRARRHPGTGDTAVNKAGRHPHPLEPKVQWGQVTNGQAGSECGNYCRVRGCGRLLPSLPCPAFTTSGAAWSFCSFICLLSVPKASLPEAGAKATWYSTQCCVYSRHSIMVM